MSMGGLLGPVGGLEELKCASSLDREPAADTLLEVVRAADGTEYAHAAPTRANRSWSVSVDTARPEQIERLEQLALLQQAQRRPLVYFPEDALVENMLDPAAAEVHPARWVGITTGGARAIPLEHGTVRFLSSGMSPSNGSWASLAGFPAPFLRTLTVSAVLSAYPGLSAALSVVEHAMDGTEVREHLVQTSVDGVLERLHATFETAHETATLTIRVKNANTIAVPQVTATDTVMPWAAGAGCMNAALVGPPSKSVQLAFVIPNDWGRRSAHSWSIREIGHHTNGHRR